MEVEDELAMGPEGGDDELEMGAMEDEEEIVAEVARRVAARLQKSQDQENLVNTISERIFQRLTSK